MNMQTPSLPTPEVMFDTLGHGRLDPVGKPPPNGAMVVFFRHAQCGICRYHLKDLDGRIGDFAVRGVMLIAASADTAENARVMVEEMQLIRLPVSHCFDLAAARDQWGLLFSQGRADSKEPAVFFEPGHFWIRQDGSIGFSEVHSSPYMLSEVAQILLAIENNTRQDAPASGAYAGELALS
jgi:peroxiredoxin